MKLNIEQFEDLAKRKGYKNGYIFWRHIGGGKCAYSLIKQGNQVGQDIVKDMYNEVGEQELQNIIDFEKETIDGFKAKYIEINGKLY